MPGPQIKNWRVYHGLRRRGYSKSRAAAIANSPKGRRKGQKKGGKKSGRKRKKKRSS